MEDSSRSRADTIRTHYEKIEHQLGDQIELLRQQCLHDIDEETSNNQVKGRYMHRTSQSEFRAFLLSEVASVKRGLEVLARSREVSDDDIITAIQQ